jgi:hypothetical protein
MMRISFSNITYPISNTTLTLSLTVTAAEYQKTVEKLTEDLSDSERKTGSLRESLTKSEEEIAALKLERETLTG